MIPTHDAPTFGREEIFRCLPLGRGCFDLPLMRQLYFSLLVPVLFALGGCASPTEVQHPVTVKGGRMIGIPFGPQGPLPGRGNGYEVRQASMGPGPGAQDSEAVYQFAVSIPPGVKLQRVQVEDISEEQFSPLVDDRNPWLTDDHWQITTPPMKPDDPRLAWMYTVTLSVRVYEFTITDTTGKQTVLHQVIVYPDLLKSLVRKKWGEKY
jgi:hypothetical protein